MDTSTTELIALGDSYRVFFGSLGGRSGTVRNFASLYEDNTLDQALRLARGHVTDGPVIMLPDAHFGSGACVGTAVRTVGGLYPAAVGVDIGCGMIAVRTTVEAASLDVHQRQTLRNLLLKAIPSGVGRRRETQHPNYGYFESEYGQAPVFAEGELSGTSDADRYLDTAAEQFGTLGAGNHFVEVSEDEAGLVWLVVHSGSRGIGNAIARHFVAEAQRQCREAGVELEDRDLAYVSGERLDTYVANMLWAQDYARENREAMMQEALGALIAVAGGFETGEGVNCHHNYSLLGADGAWVTRKGAIYAGAGALGVLPGSMATDTYIVEGLGNPDSYETAPHGAGRLHARGRPPKHRRSGEPRPGTGAWAKFTVEEFREAMEARGVTWQERDAFHLLDESPMMYKPIEVVLEDSRRLVKPRARLTQIVNVKGL